MIKNTAPLSMAETLEYVKGETDSETEVKKFIKKFMKMKPEKAREIRKKINELGLIKVKQEHIVKIIDLVPENHVDLNKIFTDVSLDENEAKQILEAIQK